MPQIVLPIGVVVAFPARNVGKKIGQNLLSVLIRQDICVLLLEPYQLLLVVNVEFFLGRITCTLRGFARTPPMLSHDVQTISSSACAEHTAVGACPSQSLSLPLFAAWLLIVKFPPFSNLHAHACFIVTLWLAGLYEFPAVQYVVFLPSPAGETDSLISSPYMTSRMAMSLQRSSLASKDSPLLTLSQKRLLSTWDRFTICPMLLVPVLMSKSHCCSAVQKRFILRASTELMGTRKREQLRFAASNRMGLSVSNTVSLSNLNTLGYPILSRGVEYCISLTSLRKRFRGFRPLSAHQRWEFRPPPKVFIISKRPYDLLVTPSKLSPVWLGTTFSRKMFAVSPRRDTQHVLVYQLFTGMSPHQADLQVNPLPTACTKYSHQYC